MTWLTWLMTSLVSLARAIAARIRVMGWLEWIGLGWIGMAQDGKGWDGPYLAPPALTQAVVKLSTLTSLTSSG